MINSFKFWMCLSNFVSSILWPSSETWAETVDLYVLFHMGVQIPLILSNAIFCFVQEICHVINWKEAECIEYEKRMYSRKMTESHFNNKL